MGTHSRLSLWQQGTQVPHTSPVDTVVHTPVGEGPSDGKFEIRLEGGRPIQADRQGNFLFDPTNHPEAFDAVHTFAVAKLVHQVFARALRAATGSGDITWQWGDQPLILRPRAREGRGASYSRHDRGINFLFLPVTRFGSALYTCQSFDIVAHEVGHAILDGIKPGLHRTRSRCSETVAIHESFGDLAAIFTFLGRLKDCRRILEHSFQLRSSNTCAAVAERYGRVVYGRHTGLRTAFNDFRLGQQFATRHQLSQVLTGAIYCAITYLFEEFCSPEREEPAETLRRVASHMLTLLMTGILAVPDQNCRFEDLGRAMLAAEVQPVWSSTLQREFEKRRIL